MSTAPLEVLSRPFAIEPFTNMMLPDGIFDNALYTLLIAAHVTNTSDAPLTNVSIYLESVDDPGITPVGRTYAFASIPAGAAVLVTWEANFQFATAGKHLVSFVARADGFGSRRSIPQIFVSQTRFDSATNSYTCTVGEGVLHVSHLQGHLPAQTWGRDQDGKGCRCPPPWGPIVPTGVTMAWSPVPAYAGDHGELPFADPWWKILAVIVAIVAAVVAAIAAAVGSGKANFSAGGTVEETDPSVTCCTPKGAASGKPELTVAGVASAIASAALVVACSDKADPFWRGQEATPPAAGELTTGERVVAKWKLSEAPNAGKAYATDVEWTYQRFTTGASYSHAVSETQVNIHVAGNVEVDAPAVVAATQQPLWVRCKFQKQDGHLFRGTDLYAFVVFQAPGFGLSFVASLTDDGLGFDPGANDGVYAGSLDLRRARRLLLSDGEDVYGIWRVFVYAQDVNLTKPGTPPEIAAQHIGGFFVASSVHITFDPTLPCPLAAVTTIDVV